MHIFGINCRKNATFLYTQADNRGEIEGTMDHGFDGKINHLSLMNFEFRGRLSTTMATVSRVSSQEATVSRSRFPEAASSHEYVQRSPTISRNRLPGALGLQ